MAIVSSWGNILWQLLMGSQLIDDGGRRPAGLGLLALGAPGLDLWRKDRTQRFSRVAKIRQ
jgi:hypothetical protein